MFPVGIAHIEVNTPHVRKTQDKRPSLTCWYTNADTLTNKMIELKNRINNADKKPHIIAVTEAKPKNARYPTTAAELSIKGYELHSTCLQGREGRGTIIYTEDGLKANVKNQHG